MDLLTKIVPSKKDTNCLRNDLKSKDTAKNMKHGFDIRFENYNIIHENSDKDWAAFMSALDPKDNEIILDAAGGYGDVSQHIFEIAKPKIYILDNSRQQLNRLKKIKILSGAHVKNGDIRKMDFPDNFFDSCILKMGIHEVPGKDQIKIFNEIFRVLKPKGKFVTWELALTNDNQKFFQTFIHKKDELSGFTGMMENRYFPKHSETLKNFKAAGFKNVHEVYTKYYHPNLKLRAHELVSTERATIIKNKGKVSLHESKKLKALSVGRIQELTEFTKILLTKKIMKAVKFKEDKSGIDFEIEKKIYIGYKP